MEWTECEELREADATIAWVHISGRLATSSGGAEDCINKGYKTRQVAWHNKPLASTQRWTSFSLWFGRNGLQPLVSCWCSRYLEPDSLQSYSLIHQPHGLLISTPRLNMIQDYYWIMRFSQLLGEGCIFTSTTAALIPFFHDTKIKIRTRWFLL